MEFPPPASLDEAIAAKAGQPAATGRDLTRVPVRPEHITGT
jgi:hypothetical protein